MRKKATGKLSVIVTGGAGFIGSHVVEQLLKRGHQVQVIDNMSTGLRSNLPTDVKLHRLDVRTSNLTALFRRVKPDAIIHLAANIDLRRSVNEPAYDADVNLVGGLRVLEACVAAQVPHVAFASSAAVYGAAEKLPLAEGHRVRPSSPYGLSKLTFEKYLDIFRDLHGLSSVALRFANVYGPRQSVHGEAGIVAIFLDRFMRGETPVINGNGRQTRDYVFVQDVARMVVLSVERQLSGVYNVSTGRETSVNEMYDLIRRLGKFAVTARRGPAKPGEDKRVALSPRRAQREGWQAKHDVAAGLRLTVAWAMKRQAAPRRRS